MPRKGEQRKIGDFFPTPTLNTTKSKHGTKKGKIDDDSPPSVISLDSGESDWDARGSRLAPSSQITSLTEKNERDSDGSEAPVEQSPLAKRRRRMAAAQIVSDVDTSGSDDHIPLNLRGKRKSSVIDDPEDEQVQSPSKKRKFLVKGLKPTAEEENIMDGLDKDVLVEPRLRPGGKKSAYSMNLERRKRERLGLPKESSQSNSSQEVSGDSENTISENEVDAKFNPIPGARNPNAKGAVSPDPADGDPESSGGDTEDFVVNDEDEGIVDSLDLPIQFSMRRAQPLAASFKVFFQFLVHVACEPPHIREQYVEARLSGDTATAEYFKNAINHLRKTLGAIRDSQVASTIWNAQFRKTLEDLPELDMAIIEVEPYCHACRRNAALSTRQVRLGGQAYNKSGFQPLEESPDEEVSDEESDSSESSEEDALETFNLGQHCARRVSLFHAFAHWEYSLFKAIEAEIAGFETLNREMLLKKKKKRHLINTNDPDHILELLDKKRMVDQQWKEIQNMMERAKTVETRKPGEID